MREREEAAQKPPQFPVIRAVAESEVEALAAEFPEAWASYEAARTEQQAAHKSERPVRCGWWLPAKSLLLMWTQGEGWSGEARRL